MSTEIEVLKKIFKVRDKTPIRLISDDLGYGMDYVRFICKKLEEKNLVKTFGRDWYKITSRGQRELERMGLVRRTLRKGLKIENPIWERVQIPSTPSQKVIKLKFEFGEPKAEKLNLGKTIEKVASLLGKLRV